MATHPNTTQFCKTMLYIERDQHEALREISFKERRSMSDLAREALRYWLREYKRRQKK
jgi:hypothetical protein